MKITSVSTTVVDAGDRDWVFVRVDTDEPGLFGWGEASLSWHTRGVCGAVEDFAVILVGKDPRLVEHLWQSMYRGQYFKGGIVTMSAIAGIDQALWDIKAKALGVPLFELLGGPVRDRVRMYRNLGSERGATRLPIRVPRVSGATSLRRCPAERLLLRRHLRASANCGARRDLLRLGGAAQPERTDRDHGEHPRGACTAELPDPRAGP